MGGDKSVCHPLKKQELEESINRSNLRRQEELQKVFSKVKELEEHYGKMPLILAGDLNSTVSSPVYKKIIETYKLKDSMGDYSPIPYTWNPKANQKNHQYTEKFGVSVPIFGKKELEDFFKEYNYRQRRIDYVFVSQDIEVLSYSLFAEQPNVSGDCRF